MATITITKSVREAIEVSINPTLAENLFNLISFENKGTNGVWLPYSTAGAHQIGRAIADYTRDVFDLAGGKGQPFLVQHKSGSTTRVICKESEHGYAWDVKTTRANNRGYVDHIAKARRDLVWQAQFVGSKPTFAPKEGEIKTLDYVVRPTEIPDSVLDELAYTKHVILRLFSSRQPFTVSGGYVPHMREGILFGFNAENAWLDKEAQKVSE